MFSRLINFLSQFNNSLYVLISCVYCANIPLCTSVNWLREIKIYIADFVYPVQTLWFSWSQILAILFRPFGFLAPRFQLSCLDPLVFLLPDFSYPAWTLWFFCSHILTILFRPFGFLAPRFQLSCLDPLVFLLPYFDYPVQTLWFSCSQIVTILFRPFDFLAPRF